MGFRVLLLCVCVGLAGGGRMALGQPAPATQPAAERVAATQGVLEADGAEQPRYFIVLMDGRKAGWAVFGRAVVESGKERLIRSEQHVVLRVARMGEGAAMQMRVASEERADGTPLSFSMSVDAGAFSMGQEGRFLDREGRRVVRLQAMSRGRATGEPSEVEVPEGLVGMDAAAERVRAAYLAGGKQVSLVSLSPGASEVPWGTVVAKFEGEEEVEQLGVRRLLSRVRLEQEMGGMELVTQSWVDAAGQDQVVRLGIGGMELELVAASEALAKADFTPAEMMVQTLIRPEGSVAGLEGRDEVVYELRAVRAGDRVARPVDTGMQTVEALADGSGWRVRVRRGAPRAAALEGVERERSLASSPMIDHATLAVAALARRLAGVDGEVGGEAGEGGAEKGVGGLVGRLTAGVGKYITKKDLSRAFDSAGTVVQTRQGDCTEHAVLLAAVLRAHGIPSRVAMGLVFVERIGDRRDVFGYHAWTQAWVDGAWHDLDATRPDQRPLGVGYICLSASALTADGFFSELLSPASAVGNLRIRIVEGGGGD